MKLFLQNNHLGRLAAQRQQLTPMRCRSLISRLQTVFVLDWQIRPSLDLGNEPYRPSIHSATICLWGHYAEPCHISVGLANVNLFFK